MRDGRIILNVDECQDSHVTHVTVLVMNVLSLLRELFTVGSPFDATA